MTKPPQGRRVVRVFTNFKLSQLDIDYILAGFRLHDTSAKVIFNKSGRCDLAVVVNFSRGAHFVWGSEMRLAKWLMEPTVSNRVNWRFTHLHSRIFSKVYSHNASSSSNREVISPPLVPPHVPALEPSYLIDKKTKKVSAIGSKQTALEFHKVRTEILDRIEATMGLGIDVFGKGRTYIESKLEGLIDYRYSIAIENSLTDHYWTEKISDCFLTLTVPIYLGAPNINEYFPAKSLITVTQDELESRLPSLLDRLSDEDYQSRLPELLSARNLILNNYNFGKEIAILLDKEANGSIKRKLFSRVWTSDSVISFVFWFASSARSLLFGNSKRVLKIEETSDVNN